ncbi:MAG: hypothetical protein P8169_14255 [Chloroflexota bacterium]
MIKNAGAIAKLLGLVGQRGLNPKYNKDRLHALHAAKKRLRQAGETYHLFCGMERILNFALLPDD